MVEWLIYIAVISLPSLCCGALKVAEYYTNTPRFKARMKARRRLRRTKDFTSRSML